MSLYHIRFISKTHHVVLPTRNSEGPLKMIEASKFTLGRITLRNVEGIHGITKTILRNPVYEKKILLKNAF
jgi:hypothetical protein